jgi:hypothetical protein
VDIHPASTSGPPTATTGNLLLRQDSGGRTTYTWDGENRAALVQLPGAVRSTLVRDGRDEATWLPEPEPAEEFL